MTDSPKPNEKRLSSLERDVRLLTRELEVERKQRREADIRLQSVLQAWAASLSVRHEDLELIPSI